MGDRDDFADVEALAAWARRAGAGLEVLAGADHFFMDRLQAVRAWTARILQEQLAPQGGGD